MKTRRWRQVLLFFAAAGGCSSLSVDSPALGADASPWATEAHSAMRLIAGSPPGRPGEPLRAGVEVKLAPGWKTYWRYPGDSGVPPRFDFAQSQNVKSVTVSWPAPLRFADPAGYSIGYKQHVIWPLRIEPEHVGRPVRLRLKIDYAICEKLCIPLEATAELSLADGTSGHEAALAAAEARVPKRAILGQGSPAIRAVRRDGAPPRARITVEVDAPADEALDLFVEGPSADWALPLPAPAPAPDGGRRFTFELDGLPAGAKAEGAELRFTLVGRQRATEVTTRLD